jgi:hypothetical protein
MFWDLGKRRRKLPHDAHDMNLCYLANDGYQCQDTNEYRRLVKNPRYICRLCGRAARDRKNLCRPVPLYGDAELVEEFEMKAYRRRMKRIESLIL